MKRYLAFFMAFFMVIPSSVCVLAAEESAIDSSALEDSSATGDSVEITDFTLDGYRSIYNPETEMYTFEALEENKVEITEEIFYIQPESVSTQVQYSDEFVVVDSGIEQGDIRGIENDNADVMATAASLPDLYVYDLKATSDLIVGQDQSRFSYKVANLGGSAAQSVEVAFVVSNRVVGTYNLGDIGAGQAVGGYFALGKISQSGTYGIGVYADPGNKIEESNETNNSLGQYFTWYNASEYKPDLTVSIESPTDSSIQGSKNSSDTREFVFKISNIGPKATSANGFQMAVYADNKKIGTMQVPQMNAMVEQYGRFNLGVNGYKPFTLNLVVDEADAVEESNESNNSHEKEYSPYYCRHLSDIILLDDIPYPGNNIRVQVAPSALFHTLTNNFYNLYAKKWNGITDQCRVTGITNGEEVSNDTQVYICGGYRDSMSSTRGATELVWLPNRTRTYIRIGLDVQHSQVNGHTF